MKIELRRYEELSELIYSYEDVKEIEICGDNIVLDKKIRIDTRGIDSFNKKFVSIQKNKLFIHIDDKNVRFYGKYSKKFIRSDSYTCFKEN